MSSETTTYSSPCSHLDIEGTQTWLEDMAAEGWLLQKCSIWRWLYHFAPCDPIKVRYRLLPMANREESWTLKPDEKCRSLAQDFGWSYVCRCGNFFVYRSYDEGDRELYTDPVIQEQSLHFLMRASIRHLILVLLTPLLFPALLVLLAGPDYIWRAVVAYSVYCLITLLLFADHIAEELYDVILLLRTRNRLKHGILPTARKEWRKSNSVFLWLRRAFLIFVILFPIYARAVCTLAPDSQNLPSPDAELPFVTVCNLAEQSGVESVKRHESSSMHEQSTILSPVYYDWNETANIISADGEEGMVSIGVNYYELCGEWLADRLANEYKRHAIKTGTPMEKAADSGWDMAYFYLNSYGKPAAVLQKEKIVMRVEFPRQDLDDPYLNFDYWIETMLTKLNSASR